MLHLDPKALYTKKLFIRNASFASEPLYYPVICHARCAKVTTAENTGKFLANFTACLLLLDSGNLSSNDMPYLYRLSRSIARKILRAMKKSKADKDS